MSCNTLFLRAWKQMAWDIRAGIAMQRIGLINHHTQQRREVVSTLRDGDGDKAGSLLRNMIGQIS
jgi:hypothetical protein